MFDKDQSHSDENPSIASRDIRVPSSEYDHEWLLQTWGWDSPENFVITRGMNLRPRILASVEIADLRPGMRILDIGCGRGEVVLHCGRLGISGVGVDYSEQAISLAEKAKARHSPLERQLMNFICSDIRDLGVETFFDRIFLLDLVEHLHDWELSELLRTCFGLLKNDGALIIHTLPNKWIYDITYGQVLRFFMPQLPANPRTQKEMAIHVNEMTITHLARILKAAGYESRVWLQDMIVEQARWHQRQPLCDHRSKIYKFLGAPLFGSFFKLLTRTPLRLLICNDIFAVAWKKGSSQPIKIRKFLAESFIINRSAQHRTPTGSGGLRPVANA